MKIKSIILSLLFCIIFATPVLAETYPVGFPGSTTINLKDAPTPIDQNSGAFRTECLYSHGSNDDPIAKFRQPGATHAHMFFGAKGVNAYTTSESLSSSGASTCHGGIVNFSSYWAPFLRRANGEVQLPDIALLYYKHIPVNNAELVQIPKGFKAIVGDSTALNEPVGDIGWACYHGSIADAIYNGTNIPQNCPQGFTLRQTIRFPMCWNGELDSLDHRSHLVYPVRNGCTATHPKKIPNISFIFGWTVKDTNSNGMRLSSDLPGAVPGASSHADYMFGWNESFSDRWFNNCLVATKDCGVGNLGDGKGLVRYTGR